MKPKYLAGILCFFPLMTMAQTIFSGRVVDRETHNPIPLATIYVADQKITAISDSTGQFSIENLPVAAFIAEISASGYSSEAFQIKADSCAHLTFYLVHSAVEIKTIVVTGVSATTETRRSPIPIIALGLKYLEQNTSTNAIDALIKVPGFGAISTGPNISKPVIRGLSYNRILTLFDGIRQDGQQWGDEHGIEIDQFLADHVEIIKGPASLMYGSDALAGVLNIIPASPAPQGTFKGSFTQNYLSNNRSIGSSLALQGNKKGFFYGARISHKQAADYKNRYDGRVYGTKYNETDLAANLGINRKWGFSQLYFVLYDNAQEVPDGSRDSATRKFTKQVSEQDTFRPIVNNKELSNYTISALHQRVQHYRLYWSNNLYFGKHRILVNLGAQQSHRREFNHPVYTKIPGLDLTLNTATYDIKYFIPLQKKVDVVAGINGMLQQNKNTHATEFVIPNYRSFDAGPFLHIKKTIRNFDISGGIRYDVRAFNSSSLYTLIDPVTGFFVPVVYKANDTNIQQQFAAYKHIFSGVSWSLGAVYSLAKKWSIKLNAARGYRSPNIAEISARGVHPGTGFQQLGDDNLKPEFNLQGDLGIFYNGYHVTASAEVFCNSVHNYIFNQKLQNFQGGDSIFVQAGEQYPVFKFHQTHALLYGCEATIDVHPHPLDWLHFENSISIVYAQNLGGNGVIIQQNNKYLPTIPPLHTNHDIKIELGKKLHHFNDMYFKIGVQYWAAQNRYFAAYGTETYTPSYTLIETGAGTDVVKRNGKKLFSVSINISNLTDKAYQSNMNRLKYFDNYPNNYTGRSGIYNMGRNVMVRVMVPL